jgi:hypothetical protein
MKRVTGRIEAQNSLANQIKESVSQHLLLTPIEQNLVSHCNGPEDAANLFINAVSKYPNSVLKLPITAVLMEVTADGSVKLGRRKMKKACAGLYDLIQGTLNEGDLVVRTSPTKFALLLFNVDEQTGGKICQRIKEAVHRHWFIDLKQKVHLNLEFAVSQHNRFGGNDFAELIFGNEKNIRMARALGDGAIVTRKDAKEHFQEHQSFLFHLGEVSSDEFFEVNNQES